MFLVFIELAVCITMVEKGLGVCKSGLESGAAMMAAIRRTPSFSAVADRQYFAMDVDPVLRPVTVKLVAILSSLFVLDRPNSFVPCFVTCVIFSIHMVE